MKKTVLVTGSSRGIGRSIALNFAKEGYNVIINGKTESENLKSLVKEINELGCDCLHFAGDVSNPDFVCDMVDDSIKRFGKIDVLVNNAGIAYYGLLSDMSNSDWDRVISTNLSSVFYFCKAVIPSMINNKSGSIINISSVWGNVGASCEVAYSASKGAVNSFTKALAKELAPSNINVNAIACGIIDTDMNRHLTCEEIGEIVETIPAGRIGTCEEVAKAVVELSKSSNYLTGQIITIDGGWC